MRICHVTSSISSSSGGPAMALLGMADAQRKAGLDVTVVATYLPGADTGVGDRLAAAGVDVRIIGAGRGKLLRHPDMSAALDRAIAEADVVHIHALWEEIQHQAAVKCRRVGVPYVVTPHGMLTPWSLAQGRLKKRLYMAWRTGRHLRRAAAIHFTSEIERDSVAPLGLRAPTIVEPLGVDLEEFRELPAAGSFRASHPEIGDRPIVCFLGRIFPGKGLEYLVPALAAMKRTDAVLVVVGPDSNNFRAPIEAQIDAHGLRDRVVFTGMLQGRDRVPPLRDAHVFCLPSDHENFGVAVVEALAAGTPALVSENVPIGRDIAGAGVGAIVPTDPRRLAEALDRWLDDVALGQSAAARARPFVWERFDWQQIAKRWVEHYLRVAGHSAPGARAGGDGPVPVAVISNSITPYRLHVHNRIVRELPQIQLYSVFTHDVTNGMWGPTVPKDINPVDFAHGDSSSQQDRLRRAPREWSKGGRVIRWLRKNRIRAVVVQAYNDPGRLRIIRWCSRHNVPCFLSADSNILGDSARGWRQWLKRLVLPRIIRQCAGVMPVGGRGVEYFTKYGASPSRTFLYPYEPDYRRLRERNEAVIDRVRVRFSLAPQRRRIVFAGRMAPEKRPDLVIAAFAAIAEQRPQWDLVMLGDGPLRTRQEASVPDGLHPRVTWAGFIASPEEVAAIYHQCDVLVLPSDHEPWALVVNEAAAAGLAIVCTSVVGAAHELVREGVNGYTFLPGDLGAFTRALLQVTDPSRVDVMKEASKQVLEEWRIKGDPVDGLRRSLESVGVIPASLAGELTNPMGRSLSSPSAGVR